MKKNIDGKNTKKSTYFFNLETINQNRNQTVKYKIIIVGILQIIVRS